MLKKSCLIVALLLFTQTSFADDASVILKVNNSSQHMVEAREGRLSTKIIGGLRPGPKSINLRVHNSSQHPVEVREGWLIKKVRFLEPRVGWLTYCKLFRISSLRISYIDEDGQAQLIENCPKGLFHHSLTIHVFEDESKGVYCDFRA